jgi:hypothetical protein
MAKNQKARQENGGFIQVSIMEGITGALQIASDQRRAALIHPPTAE